MHQLLDFFKKNKILISILLLAFILRLLFLFIFHPPLSWFDASDYDQLAVNLIQYKAYCAEPGAPYVYREPGYSLFFLVPIYFIFGHSILAVQIFQIILCVFTALLIFYFSKKYFSKPVALLAVAFFSFYPSFIAYSTEVLTEVPFTFLLILGLFLVVKALEKNSLKLFSLSGVVFGIATLTRFISIFLPFFLLLFFYYFSRNWRRSLKYFSVILATSMILIFPWFLRNYLVFNTFIFGRVGGGILYWSGSYIPWDGEWKGHIYSLPRDLVQGLDPVSADKKMISLAIENVKEDPFGVLKIWLQKPAKTFFQSEFSDVLNRKNKFASFFKGSPFLSPLLIDKIIFGLNILIFVFALLGVFPALRKNEFISALFVLSIFYFVLFYLPLIPINRYKLPVMPYAMIFSALGLCWSYNNSRKIIRFLKGCR